MKKSILALFFILLCLNAFAQVDHFNTYRWNRGNVIAGNGQTDHSPWYEWWYYKVVLPESNDAFFFVYGVVNPWDTQKTMKGTRTQIGMGDFSSMLQVEENMPIEQFQSRYDETYVTIKNNIATDKHIKGQLKDENGESYSWDISVAHEWTFNATSWGTGRMLTNIEWYPAQASARCSGSIQSASKVYQFQDAPCYQDRNWGHSFPDWWTWIVSNHFEDSPGTTLAIGGGKPKFLGRFDPIESVAIGFRYKGKDITFRPNEFDLVKVDINFGKWQVEGKNKNYKIQINAHAPREKFLDLQFVTPEGEIFHDYEALLGELQVKLYKRKSRLSNKWQLIDTLVSHHAGIEYGSKNQYPLEPLFSGQKSLFSNY